MKKTKYRYIHNHLLQTAAIATTKPNVALTKLDKYHDENSNPTVAGDLQIVYPLLNTRDPVKQKHCRAYFSTYIQVCNMSQFKACIHEVTRTTEAETYIVNTDLFVEVCDGEQSVIEAKIHRFI